MTVRKFIFLGRPAAENDGGTIYDRRLVQAISELGAEVTFLEATRLSRFESLKLSLSHGVPPKFVRYDRDVSALIKDDVEFIVSHESLSPILIRISKDHKCWWILHNLPSAFDDVGGVTRDMLLKPLSAIAERRLLGKKTIKPILLSRREMAKLNLGSKAPRLLQPGSPPAISLTPARPQRVEFIVSGTYSWSIKRRDAVWLSEIFRSMDQSRRPPLTLYAHRIFQNSVTNWIAEEKFTNDGIIRVGVIPDRFLAGFKLKLLWYVANFCIVASPRDLSDEFHGIPFADEFIKTFNSPSELQEMAQSVLTVDVEKFSIFRDACITYFNWIDRTKEALFDGDQQW